jgi:hypothetical protein
MSGLVVKVVAADAFGTLNPTIRENTIATTSKILRIFFIIIFRLLS